MDLAAVDEEVEVDSAEAEVAAVDLVAEEAAVVGSVAEEEGVGVAANDGKKKTFSQKTWKKVACLPDEEEGI